MSVARLSAVCVCVCVSVSVFINSSFERLLKRNGYVWPSVCGSGELSRYRSEGEYLSIWWSIANIGSDSIGN